MAPPDELPVTYVDFDSDLRAFVESRDDSLQKKVPGQKISSSEELGGAMPNHDEGILRVGDIVEFHRMGNPKPDPEWHAQEVLEIRISDDYDDKEGTPIDQVTWEALREYHCLAIIVGTQNWGRNEDVRPISKKARDPIFDLFSKT